jgi:DNA-binding SARP family transcriptional activator
MGAGEQAMEFRILGPLQVFARDRPLGIPSIGKRAAVATALLVHCNQVVPAHRLSAWLWGDEPPEHVAATLRTHISRLARG